jgi:hypothetical protein
VGQRERLNEYLKSVRDVPFQWGEHDCLTFTNDAFHAMYGEGWADDWLGRYMRDGELLSRYQLIEEFGFGKVLGRAGTDLFNMAVDEKLTRINCVPPLGALITTRKAQRWITGVAMGISTGTKGVFLSDEGVLYLPLDAVEKAWIKQ